MTTLRQQYESLSVDILKKTLNSSNISQEDAELCKQVIEEKTGEKVSIPEKQSENESKKIVGSETVQTSFFEKAGNLLAIGLIIFFFVPWVKLWMFQGSAYDIAVNIGDQAVMLWGIPILAAVVIMSGLNDENAGFHKIASLLAGASPFIAIMWGANQLDIGSDIFEVCSFGAYASMVIGGSLILSALGIIKMPSSSSN